MTNNSLTKLTRVNRTVGQRSQSIMTLGQLIRQKRLERGIGGVEMAQRAQISRSYMTKLENGTLLDIRIDKLCRMTEALGLSVEDLLQEAGYLPAKPKSPLPEPADYLRERYKLSPEGVDQAVDFLEWLARRDRQVQKETA